MKKIIKKICFPLLFMGASLAGSAQTTWYFGDHAGVKFNGSGPPTFLSGSAMNTPEGCTGLVDKSNRIVLYTDGKSIWNGIHYPQPTGGTSIQLKGSASGTQTALIIPVPCDTTQAFIFTTSDAENAYGNGINGSTITRGLRVSRVSISASYPYEINLIEENVQVTPLNDNVGEKLEMVEDGNGGYWVLTHGVAVYSKHPADGGTEYNPGSGKNFYACHITSAITNTTALKNTLVTTTITSPSITEVRSWGHPGGYTYDFNQQTYPAQINGQGQLAILKKDATTAIVACAIPYAGNVWGVSKWRMKPLCQLYSFNLTTGAIATTGANQPIEFDLNFNNTDGTAKDGAAYGLALSTDGTTYYLYVTSSTGSTNFFQSSPATYATSRLYRYNITSWTPGTITGTQFKIKENVSADQNYGFGAMQRGPNGSIYVANRATNTLGEITNPNDPTKSVFVENSINWASTNPGAYCRAGLPTTILMTGPTVPSITATPCKGTVKIKTSYIGNAPNSYYWEIYGCNAAGQPVNAGGGNVYSSSLSFFYETSDVSGTYTAGTSPALLPTSLNINGTCNRYYKAVLYVKTLCGASTKMASTIFQLGCNDPSFNMAVTQYTNYFTVTSTPVDLLRGSDPGFDYCWRVDGYTDATYIYQVFSFEQCKNTSNAVWNNYPSATVYKGFDHVTYNYTGNTPVPSLSANAGAAPIGKFRYNYNYKLVRVTGTDKCGTSPEAIYYFKVIPPGMILNDQILEHGKVIISENPADLDVDVTTGINSFGTSNDLFSVYPNPSSGIFTIELSNEDKATMEVMDVTGKVIKTAQLNKNDHYTLNLSDYAKGVYMIKMNGSQQKLQKIILE